MYNGLRLLIGLQKYNNDVMRAADYIFSGHAEQDLVEVCSHFGDSETSGKCNWDIDEYSL